MVIKRTLLLLLSSLLLTTSSFSQTTYPKQLNDSIVAITTNQLKQANLVFLEHSRLKQEKAALLERESLYNLLLENAARKDSLNQETFKYIEDAMTKQEKSYKKKLIKWKVGSSLTVFGLVAIICLL